MTEEKLVHFVKRLFENADETLAEYRADRKNELASGSSVAYYEMLDILQSELDVAGQDLKKYGLNVNLVGNYTG